MANTAIWAGQMIANGCITLATFVCAIIAFRTRREPGIVLIAVALGLQAVAFIPSVWILFAVRNGNAYLAGIVSFAVTAFVLFAAVVNLLGWILLAVKRKVPIQTAQSTAASVTPVAGQEAGQS